MPGNGLSLAIRIGGEDDAVGVLDQSGDVGKALAGLAVHFPQHFEVVGRVDRAILGWQVTYVSERGDDLEILAEIFVDRLGLGRRFDDDDVHAMTPEDRMTGQKAEAGRALLPGMRRKMGERRLPVKWSLDTARNLRKFGAACEWPLSRLEPEKCPILPRPSLTNTF